VEPADVVLRFLDGLGRRSEAEFYLALFRAEPKEQFAAISVDANVARHATEAVVLDLKFLAGLGLMPVVVLGLFEPTDAAEHAARIRRRLERQGVAAQVLGGGESADLAELAAQVRSSARAGTLPILTFGVPPGQPGEPAAPSVRSEAAVEERFGRMAVLMTVLRTRKLIFLHRPGGLRQGGALLPLVNLTTDVPSLSSSKELSRKERMMVAQSRRLVFDLVPHKLLSAVTSPLNLFRELFTTKGAGTLLRRGAVLTRHDGFDAIDRARLRGLLESAFGRPPRDEFFERPISRAYVEENYRGAALLIDTPLGAYLTKFAVDREAQGEGMGRDLWEQLAAEHKTVFWRARPANPIVAWYTQLCDGLVRFPEWNVFWKGLAPDKIPEAIAYSLAQPIDIVNAAVGE